VTIDLDALEAFREAVTDHWERDVRREGRSAEWRPLALLVADDGTRTVVGLADMETGEPVNTADLMVGLLARIVSPSVASVALALDSYIALGEEAMKARDAVPLSRLWQEGFPGVEECMMIAAVDRAGAQMVLPMPYEIKGRKLRWLEDPLDGSTKEAADLVAGGRLSDALVALMTRGSN